MSAEQNVTVPEDDRRDAVEQQLVSLVRELGREMQLREATLRELSANTSLEQDLGLDSLTRVELLARIERGFSVRLATEDLTRVERLADLRDLILRVGGKSGHEPVKRTSDMALEEAESSPASRETLTEVLEWHLQVHPDRPHIQLYDELGEGDIITFQDLYRGALGIAGGLQQQGLNRGDTVALMLPSGKDYFFSFFGVLLAGGIPVSLYPPTRPSQLEDHLRRHQKILENSGASRLIAFPEVRAFSRLLKANVPSLKQVSSAEEVRRHRMEPHLPRLRGEDLAFLQYTSGSTGNPKGVALTHFNLLSNIRALGDRMEVSSRDVIFSWLPLYHDMGLIGCWLGSLYYSCLFVVMSPMDFIAHPESWLWACHRYRGTISAAPNFAYELCLKRIPEQERKGLDLSSWRVASNGAEAVSPETVRRFVREFRHYGFAESAMMPVYGLAENSVGLTLPPVGRPPLIDRVQRDLFTRSGIAEPAPAGDDNALEFVACGSPLKGNEIRIVDELGRELPDRREGALQFRGPSATSGYYLNPVETEKLFSGDWLNSGDRAYTADGDVYITGRSKDIIIHGGRNLYPEELEHAVGEIEGIRKGCVAVFGSAHQRGATEKLVVVAETRTTDSDKLDKLRRDVNRKTLDVIGTPPDDIVLAPPHSVLKTSSGKIRRSATRQAYEEGNLGPRDRSPRIQVARLLSSALLPQFKRWRRIAGGALYGAWFWLVAGLVTPFVWLSVVLAPGEKRRWWGIRMWGRLLGRLLAIPVEVHGADRLPAEDGPCLFIANHSSYVDVFALLAAMPRPFYFVTKAELRNNWIARTPLDRMGVEYVTRQDRQQGARDARRLVESAREGKSLFYFPEGTFTQVNGIYPFHMGAFLTAIETNLPLVPVAITGSRAILRPGSARPRPGRIEIIIGEPMMPAGVAEEDERWNNAVKLRDRARQWILDTTREPDLAHERPPIW